MAFRGRTQMELYDRSQMMTDGGDRGRHIWKALASGLAAGLAATWVMTQYQVNSYKLIAKLQAKSVQPGESQAQSQSESENPTVKVANAITSKLAGREVPPERRQAAGNLVHLGYGTLMGGIYGVLREVWPAASTARGVAYGALLWAAGDEVALPALKLARWAPEYPLQVHVNALFAHLVYAFSLDSTYRGVRRLSDLPARKALYQGYLLAIAAAKA